jgi:hypothetical protein
VMPNRAPSNGTVPMTGEFANRESRP